MVIVNDKGYMERKADGRETRNWWLVKQHGNYARIPLRTVTLPDEYLGKRIRIKVEVIEEPKEE